MSWTTTGVEEDSAFDIAGSPTINVLLENVYSEHQFLRLFRMYWQMSARISRINIGGGGGSQDEQPNASVMFPRERETYPYKRWLNTWFGASRRGVEGVAKALDSLVRYSNGYPGFKTCYTPTKSHKYVLEILLKILHGCGFGGCTLPQLIETVVGSSDKFFSEAMTEQFDSWPRDQDLEAFIETLVIKNSSQVPGETPLFCKFGDPLVYVLTELVNSNEIDQDDILFSECCAKVSPLHLAAMCGDFAAFRYFLGIEEGATVVAHDFKAVCEPGTVDMFGNSIVHIATASFGATSNECSHAMVRAACAFDLPIDKRNNMGLSPLHIAASERNVLAIECLLDLGAVADTGALKLAAVANSEACVSVLLRNGTNPVDVENEVLRNTNILPDIVQVARKWLLQRVSWPQNSLEDRVKLWAVDARPAVECSLPHNVSVEFSKEHCRMNPRPTPKTLSRGDSTELLGGRSTLRSIAQSRDIGLLVQSIHLSNKLAGQTRDATTGSPPIGRKSKGSVFKQKIQKSQEIFLKAAIANNDIHAVHAAILRGASISQLEHSCAEAAKEEAAKAVGDEDYEVRDLASVVARRVGGGDVFGTIPSVCADPNSNYWMPLHAAVASGSEEMVKLLLAYGARVNLTNEFGRSPLHFVASISTRQDVELIGRRRTYRSRTLSEQDIKDFVAEEEQVKIREEEIRDEALRTGQALLELGADACLPDKYGWRPLHVAVYRGDYVFTKLLLMYGANFTECCGGLEQDFVHGGLSALHIAVVQKHVPVLGLMLFTPATAGIATAWASRGRGAVCTIDPLDVYGRTPMFYAAAGYDVTTIAILANAGGDINTQDKSGSRMIDNIKPDYETSTGQWGAWLLALLVSNGAVIDDTEIEMDTISYDAAVGVYNARQKKLELARQKKSFNSKASLLFWANASISPPCFLCGGGAI